MFYYLIVSGGVEIARSEAFDDYLKRDEAAKIAYQECDDANVFWLDTPSFNNDVNEITVGSYSEWDE